MPVKKQREFYELSVCKQVIGFKSKNFTVPLNIFINFTHQAISSKNSDDKKYFGISIIYI
jgi:hypothetical protein